MGFMVNICRNCRWVQTVVEGAVCDKCGETMEHRELCRAYIELGQEHNALAEENEQLKEAVPA